MAPKVVGVKRDRTSVAPPTMRLITLANCESTETVFGIKPLETSPAMATPIEHSAYELTELPVVEPRAPRAMPWEEDDAAYIKFRSRLPLAVTGDTIYEHIAKPLLAGPCDAPQRSDAWHLSRSFAVTASQFASAANENPSMSQNKLLASKIFPTKHGFGGNSFTEWGTIHEKHAEEAFVSFLCKVNNSTATTHETGSDTEIRFSDGLCITHEAHKRDAAQPFLGFSPDGLLWNADKTEVALIEYKCPAYQRSGPGHPYAAKNDLCIPRQYMPQIQGSLQLMRGSYTGVRCVRAWFVVWQAHQFFVTHVPYVPRFADKIVQASSSFFKDRFLPACADAVTERDKSVAIAGNAGVSQ